MRLRKEGKKEGRKRREKREETTRVKVRTGKKK